MQLLDFQSNPVWKNKFVNLRAHLEDLERERSTGIASKNPDCEILKVWNSIPENFGALKTLAKAILTIFLSTYACEALFSALNNIISKKINRMGADLSAACVALKCTHYDIPIDQLSSGTQQQKSHRTFVFIILCLITVAPLNNEHSDFKNKELCNHFLNTVYMYLLLIHDH